MAGTKMKTKCYYTDYVNHMIRFYLSTPTGLDLLKRKYTAASVENWTAVQLVISRMPEQDADTIRGVFGCGHYLPKAVDDYCQQTGANVDDVWRVLTKVNAKIARVRGLM